MKFFLALWNSGIPRICIENPVGHISQHLPGVKAQKIQPHDFGSDASKGTCLWLRNLPHLTPALRIPGRMVEHPPGSGKMVERWANQTDAGQNKLCESDDRWALRSITYPGIAAAMALQWSTSNIGGNFDPPSISSISLSEAPSRRECL